MPKLFFFIFLILLSGCENNNQLKNEPVFTSSDSTEVVNQIIDSLRAEMYLQWFMEPLHTKYTCYELPDFNPKVRILINDMEEIIVGNQVNPKNISKKIVQFYSSNLYKNDITNNDPLYSEISRKQIESEIKGIEDQIIEMKNNPGSTQGVIDFKQRVITEWQNKLKVLKILSITKLREPHNAAGIELDYPEKCKINEQVLDSIFLGFYKIREIDAKIYFDESYAKIFWKATTHGDSIAKIKLEAFKTLHPVHVMDYRKSRYKHVVIAPPPPVVE